MVTREPRVRQQECLEPETVMVLGDAVQLLSPRLAGKTEGESHTEEKSGIGLKHISAIQSPLLTSISWLLPSLLFYSTASLFSESGGEGCFFSWFARGTAVQHFYFPLCPLTIKSTFLWWLLPKGEKWGKKKMLNCIPSLERNLGVTFNSIYSIPVNWSSSFSLYGCNARSSTLPKGDLSIFRQCCPFRKTSLCWPKICVHFPLFGHSPAISDGKAWVYFFLPRESFGSFELIFMLSCP